MTVSESDSSLNESSQRVAKATVIVKESEVDTPVDGANGILGVQYAIAHQLMGDENAGPFDDPAVVAAEWLESESEDDAFEKMRDNLIGERDWHRHAAMEDKRDYGGPVGDSDDQRMNHGEGFAFHSGFQAGLSEALDQLDMLEDEIDV